MKSKPYTAKTLSGAQARVRLLENLHARTTAMLDRTWAERDRMREERKLLAMLAADGPCFSNPLQVMAVKAMRDRILHDECGFTRDGKLITVAASKEPA